MPKDDSSDEELLGDYAGAIRSIGRRACPIVMVRGLEIAYPELYGQHRDKLNSLCEGPENRRDMFGGLVPTLHEREIELGGGVTCSSLYICRDILEIMDLLEEWDGLKADFLAKTQTLDCFSQGSTGGQDSAGKLSCEDMMVVAAEGMQQIFNEHPDIIPKSLK